MNKFHVRYWFESNSSDRTGEQVIEAVESPTAEQVAQDIQKRMLSERIFAVAPAFGAAANQKNRGLVLIQAAQVRYVEILPAPTVG